MDDANPLTAALDEARMFGVSLGRRDPASRAESEAAERAVRASLARIRVVVEDADRFVVTDAGLNPDGPGYTTERDVVTALAKLAGSLDALTADDRRLLGTE